MNVQSLINVIIGHRTETTHIYAEERVVSRTSIDAVLAEPELETVAPPHKTRRRNGERRRRRKAKAAEGQGVAAVEGALRSRLAGGGGTGLDQLGKAISKIEKERAKKAAG